MSAQFSTLLKNMDMKIINKKSIVSKLGPDKEFHAVLLNRGRVQTTWTNDGEGGCSDDHNSYLVKVST